MRKHLIKYQRRLRQRVRQESLFFEAAAKEREFMRVAEKNKNSSKKLLTKQTTCDKMNKLLLSGNSTLTNKQQCNPERFLINRM